MESSILRWKRTDEAKELRRKGIAKFGMKQYRNRTDGVFNTLTTFVNDNLLLEPHIMQRGHGFNDGGLFNNESPTITASSWEKNNHLIEPSGNAVFYPERGYTQSELKELILSGKARVRELTARECFRLQGVADDDIDKIYATRLSNRQMIALAGNSITVDVFFHILRKLYIDKGNEEQPTLFDGLE